MACEIIRSPVISELVPVRFDPVSARRDAWARYHEMRRLRHAELNPDDPLEPDEIVELQMKRPNPFELRHHYEISRDAVMLIEIYDEPLPESLWAEYAAQRTALLNTMPFEDLDIGTIIITPERVREHYERMAEIGEVEHEVLTREPD